MSEIILPKFFAFLFWVAILLLIYLFLEVRDWWQYDPLPRKLRCAVLGHDYHDGAARNIQILAHGKDPYVYDFCQRCHTEQNRREVTS